MLPTFLNLDGQRLYVGEADPLLAGDPACGPLNQLRHQLIALVVLISLVFLRHKVLETWERGTHTSMQSV